LAGVGFGVAGCRREGGKEEGKRERGEAVG